MKRGLAIVFLVWVTVSAATGYLYVRIEHGSMEAFLEGIQRRWSLATQNGPSQRYQFFRSQTLPEIQRQLQHQKLDGWLLYDYRRCNPYLYDLLPLAGNGDSVAKPAVPSEDRKDFFHPWIYFIPIFGDPFKLVHPLDAGLLDGLPGQEVYYLNQREWSDGLRGNIGKVHKVAVDPSLPPGTAKILEETGTQSASSGELIQFFLARLSVAQLERHRRAAKRLSELIPLAFAEIKSQMESGRTITIGQLKQFLLLQMDRIALRTESAPIVTLGKNTSKPYFSPAALNDTAIRAGDILILEVAARMDEPGSIYAKTAWTGFVGPAVPSEMEQAFTLCTGARNTVLQSLKNAYQNKRTITGQEADDIVKKYLLDHGPGNTCPHPVGYSLGPTLFGPGTNLDGVDHPDSKPLIPGTTFTVEPGVYRKEFGVRSAISVYLHEKEIEITTLPVQEYIIPILR